MNTTVYAGATATLVRPDSTIDESWEWVIAMFKHPMPVHAKQFTPGGFSVKLERSAYGQVRPGVGDTYSGLSARGTPVTLKIKACVVNQELCFTEQYEDSSPSIMLFELKRLDTGSRVQIKRVEMQTHSIKERLLSAVAGGFDANTAVGRLAFILKNNFAKGSSFESDDCKIVRDDSLKALYRQIR